jgi:pyruvate dehydrogenase E1 component alpha subunit
MKRDGVMPKIPATDTLLKIYKSMMLIRLTDERICQSIKDGEMAVNYYSARGQEAIPASISALLNPDDYICTIYRGMHDMLAKGLPLKLFWAELAGKMTGVCKGKGGPMHMTHIDSGVMLTTGIVGASLPIANGLALAAQVRGENKVAVAYFGDGASNIGAFHEALNMGAVWKLPVVYVCQNNGYAEHTAYAKATSVANIAQRAAAYNIPGITVDGNDPLAIFDVAQDALARARAGLGPTLIEAKTFRFCGHKLGDNDHYMPSGQKAYAMLKDPIPLYRSWLTVAKHATQDELAAIDNKIKIQIDEARDFALQSPDPHLDELFKDVYAVAI